MSEPGWGDSLAAVGCPQCDWTFLAVQVDAERLCPHCGRASLAVLEVTAGALPYTRPPELVVPFAVGDAQLRRAVDQFAAGIPYAPQGLHVAALRDRLRPVYLPMWLVDMRVQAQWQAEVGSNYQVVSHREHFRNGRWAQEKVEETRVHWEPRVGTVERAYENTPAPALDGFTAIRQRLGDFDTESAVPFQAPEANAVYRLPTRLPRDAWPDAAPVLQGRVAEECRQAAGADHIRDFRWRANFQEQNWSQMLLPLYTTYYEDDAGEAQMVFIHGQTGRLIGRRRASMRRAQRTALIVAVVAMVVGLLGIGAAFAAVFAPPLLVAAAPLLIAALLIGVSALLPVYRAWRFNRMQPADPPLPGR